MAEEKVEVKETEQSPEQLAPQHVEVMELSENQKAAAVMVSLGAENASQLYRYMDDEDIESLTLEIARLGYIDHGTTEHLLTEFYQMCLTNKAVTEGGVDYAKEVLEKAFGEEIAQELLNSMAKSLESKDFDFLNKANEKSLFAALQYERSQTIALVLSYVEPAKAAVVIEQLDVERQVEVMKGIANMESASPTAVKIIETELSKKFANLNIVSQVEIGGIDYVANIMNNLDRSEEKKIFDQLSVDDMDLVEEIRKRMFTFEDILAMDDRSVQRFIRDCDSRDVVLALKGANAELANKIFTNMSARMSQSIREDLEITTNVRIRDVEEAQQRIVGIIRSLEERNEIIILKSGKDEIIA